MLFVDCIVRVSVLIVLGSCYSLLTIILRNVDNTQRYSTALMIVFGVSWTAQCALSDWSKTELCTAVVETLHCCCSCRCRSTDTGHKIPGMGGWGGFSHLADLNQIQHQWAQNWPDYGQPHHDVANVDKMTKYLISCQRSKPSDWPNHPHTIVKLRSISFRLDPIRFIPF